MPTLVFSDKFSNVEKSILLKTFRSNAKELGIEDVDASLYLEKAPIGGDAMLGCITKLPDNQFLALFNTSNDLQRTIFALGHESVHLRQYVSGKMDDVPDGIMWCGEIIKDAIARCPLFYESLPWEVEAHSLDEGLFDKAIMVLGMEETLELMGTAK